MAQAQQSTPTRKRRMKSRAAAQRRAEIDLRRDRLAVQLDRALRRVLRAQDEFGQLLQQLRKLPELAAPYRLAQANAEGVEAFRLYLEQCRDHIKPRKAGATARPALH